MYRKWFLILLFFPLLSHAQSFGGETVTLSNAVSPVEVYINDISYNNRTREVTFGATLKNTTDTYATGLGYKVEFYRGGRLAESGEIFADLDYTFSKEGYIGTIRPSVSVNEDLIVKVPKTVLDDEYFARILVYNNTVTRYGLTYTNESIELSGTGTLDQLEGYEVKYDNSQAIVLEMEFPETYQYSETDQLNIGLFRNRFIPQSVSKSVQGSLGELGDFTDNTLSIKIDRTIFSQAGQYILELDVLDEEGNQVFDRLEIPVLIDGPYVLIQDIGLEDREYLEDDNLSLEVAIAHNSIPKVDLDITIEGDGEEFSHKQTFILKDGVFTSFLIPSDFVFEKDGQMDKITIALLDSNTGNILDQHLITFFDLPGSDISESLWSNVPTFVIVLLILAVLIGLFLLVQKLRGNSLARYFGLLLIFTTTVTTGVLSTYTSLSASALYVRETSLIPSVSLIEEVGRDGGEYCPAVSKVALIGSAYCLHQGNSLEALARVQAKEGGGNVWQDSEEFVVSRGTKLFGPYVYDLPLDSSVPEIDIRGQVVYEGIGDSVHPGCNIDRVVQTSVSKASCTVDLCTNIPGQQLELPSTSLVVVGDRCLSTCVAESDCGPGFDCVGDTDLGESYCLPELGYSCVSSSKPDFGELDNTFGAGETIYLKAESRSSLPDDQFEWSGVSEVLEDDIAIVSYSSFGDYTPSFSVISGKQSGTVSCKVEVRECQEHSDCTLGNQCTVNGYCVPSLLRATCTPYEDSGHTKKAFTLSGEREIFWDVDVSGGNGPYTYDWQGAVSSTESSPSVTYTTPGKKIALVEVSDSADYPQKVAVQCEVNFSECQLNDPQSCSSPAVCRSDLTCGLPLPKIELFGIVGPKLVGEGEQCTLGMSVSDAAKCAIVDISSGGSISIKTVNGVQSGSFDVSTGRYKLVCENTDAEEVSSEVVECLGLPGTKNF